MRLGIYVILVFSIYHLIRDILQTAGINNLFTSVFHRPHLWCRPFCNIVTFPLEIFGVIGSLIVLKKNTFGVLGIILLFSLILWPLAIWLP